MSEKNPSTDNLQAGRELDMLVAEKIMGWVRRGDNDHTRPRHTTERRKRLGQAAETVEILDWESKGPHPRLESPRDENGLSTIVFFCSCETGTIPAYSTDIAEAWKVFSVMQSRCVWCLIKQQESGTWKCIMREKSSTWRALAEADSAPLVICLCALEFHEQAQGK